MSTSSSTSPSSSSLYQSPLFTLLGLSLYVISGAFQPILVTQLKVAGLGNPKCQLYMFFYYLGPALVAMHLYFIQQKKKKKKKKKQQQEPKKVHTTDATTTPRTNDDDANDDANAIVGGGGDTDTDTYYNRTCRTSPPSSKRYLIYAAMFIATIDIIAQAMNYTGSTLAGPTVFAILYSSVGIWTALYSRIFFSRKLSWGQWFGVLVAFGGLILVVLPTHHDELIVEEKDGGGGGESQQPQDLFLSSSMTRTNNNTDNNNIIITTKDIDQDFTTANTRRQIFDTTQIQPSPLHNNHHHHHKNNMIDSTTTTITTNTRSSSFTSTTNNRTPDEIILQQESLVSLGTILIFFGSMIHAFTYIMSEAIMNSKITTWFLSFISKSSNSTTTTCIDDIETIPMIQPSSTTTKSPPPHHKHHRSIPSSSSSLFIISSQASSTESLQESIFPSSSISSKKNEEEERQESVKEKSTFISPPLSLSTANTSLDHHHNHHTHISILENAFIQGCTALFLNGLWQFIYTLPHFTKLILQPMRQQSTSWTRALFLLLSLSTLNAIHSLTFYYTLKHVKGGATTAAVMKGLQAVMVFALSWILDLQMTGTNLFSWNKCFSLILVVSGVVLYGSLSSSSSSSSPQGHYSSGKENGIVMDKDHNDKELGKKRKEEEEELFFYDVEKEHFNGKTVGYGAMSLTVLACPKPLP